MNQFRRNPPTFPQMPESLKVAKDIATVYKGTDPCIDSYSAFYDNRKLKATTMLGILRSKGVTHVYVVGLALDVCVTFSALHAAEEGFVTTVVEDACAGIIQQPSNTFGARSTSCTALACEFVHAPCPCALWRNSDLWWGPEFRFLLPLQV